jgi:hypothetical protein
MPSANLSSAPLPENIFGGHPESKTRCVQPLVYSGSLEQYTYADVTPVIGREFENLQVRDLLKADDQVVKDLALTSM